MLNTGGVTLRRRPFTVVCLNAAAPYPARRLVIAVRSSPARHHRQDPRRRRRQVVPSHRSSFAVNSAAGAPPPDVEPPFLSSPTSTPSTRRCAWSPSCVSPTQNTPPRPILAGTSLAREALLELRRPRAYLQIKRTQVLDLGAEM